MQLSDIERDVRSFVTNDFLFGQSCDLKPGDSLLDKGVIDSTGVLELVAFLESQYAITVEDDDVIPDNLDSIESIVQFVSKKLQCPA